MSLFGTAFVVFVVGCWLLEWHRWHWWFWVTSWWTRKWIY